MKALIGLGAAAALCFVLALGGCYTVDESERGALTTTGAFTSTVAPGLHFKWPLLQGITKIPIRQQIAHWECGNNPCVEAYSHDQQPANLKVSVLWRINPNSIEEVYRNYYGDIERVAERLIVPKVLPIIKTTFGRFTAVSSIQERPKFNKEVTEAIAALFYQDGVVIFDGVQIEDITFSESYEAAVEQAQQAQVEVQKLKQNAEREIVQARIVVTQATAQADAVRANALAQSEAITLRGNAEATAIKARGEALRNNPDLIALTQAERWDGVLPTTMVPGSAVPFLNLGSKLN